MKLLLWDFDDTIVSSAWLSDILEKERSVIFNNSYQFRKLQGEVWKQVEKLEKNAIEVLNLSVTKGTTVIVSNAELVWINFVLSNFFPTLAQVVKDLKITVISAREYSQSLFPRDPLLWKVHCFRGIVQSALSSSSDPLSKNQIISIGDGMHERIACSVVAEEFQIPYTSLKLFETPNPLVMWYELSLIIKNFDFLTEIPIETEVDKSSPVSVAERKKKIPSNDLMVNFTQDGHISLYYCEETIELSADEESLLRSSKPTSESVFKNFSSSNFNGDGNNQSVQLIISLAAQSKVFQISAEI